MDTMIKGVRVALLLVATSAFVAIWSSDHPTRTACVDRPVTNQPQSPSEAYPTTSEPKQVSLFVPLPEGICAGSYLIVDQSGHTGIRTVTEDDTLYLGHSQGLPAASHYSVMLGNNRWHYIRIESDASGPITVTSTTSSVQ